MVTLKEAKSELSQNGISLTKSDGEYRVAFKGTRRDDTYSEAYFTSDLQDALMTGLAMARKAGTLVTRVERTVDPIEALEAEKGSTVIQSLRQLNTLLKPVSQGWFLRRAHEGYYYWDHPTHVDNGNSVYVFSCHGCKLSLFTHYLKDVVKQGKEAQ